MAKTYYITTQLIYVTVEDRDDNTHEVQCLNAGRSMSFRANVYTNALSHYPRADHLCGAKIQDNVLVTIPTDTPSIIF